MPAIGSSSSSSLGRVASVIAISSCRRSPCASAATGTSVRAVESHLVERVTRARCVKRGFGQHRPPEREAVAGMRLHGQHHVDQRGEIREHRRDLVRAAEAQQRAPMHRQRGDVAAVEAGCVPASGASSPDSWLISVVLPAPLGPITACTSPGSTVRSTPSVAVQAAEALDQPADREERSSLTLPCRARRRASRSTT